MSQPLIMSFRPDAAEMCLDGRKTMTRRIFKKTMCWVGCDDLLHREPGANIEAIYSDRPVGVDGLDIGAPVWSVGSPITIKASRTGKGLGKVMCAGLRVERVQDITEEEAQREGVEPVVTFKPDGLSRGGELEHRSYRAGFQFVWRRLNPRGPHSWDSNPPVVVIEFEPMEVPLGTI